MNALRHRPPHSCAPPRDIRCHTQILAAPGADGTATGSRARSPWRAQSSRHPRIAGGVGAEVSENALGGRHPPSIPRLGRGRLRRSVGVRLERRRTRRLPELLQVCQEPATPALRGPSTLYRLLGSGGRRPQRCAGAWAMRNALSSPATPRPGCSMRSSGNTWMIFWAPRPTGAMASACPGSSRGSSANS